MTARKVDYLKAITGTYRPDRAVVDGASLPALDVAPGPPSWMADTGALREWHRLAPVLTANRLLTDGNIGLFGQLCALHGKLVQMWQAGETPTAALIAAFRGLSGELGLLSMTLHAPAAKPNRFLSNGRKPR